MSDLVRTAQPMPPHLSMDEYVDYIEALLLERSHADVMRQKEIEERIQVAFRIPDDAPTAMMKQSR